MSEEENVSNIYSTAGNYTVTVFVTDSENNSTSDTTSAIIKEEIEETEAILNGPHEKIVYRTVFFRGHAVGGFSPYAYHWDFGDGETSEEQNPIHNYDATGTYIATITVTDRKGYIANNSTTATIAEELAVEASPYVVEGLVNEPVHLYGSAIGGFPQYTWHWDFGDGNFSDEQNPIHSYSRADMYYVSLRVADRLGNYDYAYSGAKITNEKNPIVEIRKPQKALYINNIKILPFFTPIKRGFSS